MCSFCGFNQVTKTKWFFRLFHCFTTIYEQQQNDCDMENLCNGYRNGSLLKEQTIVYLLKQELSLSSGGKSFLLKESPFFWREVLSFEEKFFLFHTKLLSQSFYDYECVEASQLICLCSNWCTSWRWLLFVCSFNLNKMNF